MRKSIISAAVWCVVALLGATSAASSPAARVPGEYQALYAELDGQLTRFNQLVTSRGDGQKAPVVFSGELLSANGHLGPALIRPGHLDATLLEVDRLRTLGLRAVTVQISFPMLYRPFFRSDEEFAAYLDFYRRLADAIRGRGLKLVVKTQALFSKGGWTSLDPGAFYRRLSLADYIQGRTQVALTVAREVKPDYLALVSEPDTEADQTGFPMDVPANSVRLVTSVLTALKSAGVSGILVGAGVGTWLPKYREFVQAYAGTGLDFIDLHVYPVNRDFLDRAVTVAQIARQSGKRVTMSEAWLYKAGNTDLVKGFAAESIFGRDAFRFWEPLDRKFLEVMVTFAHAQRLEFLSPFWTKYFYAYVDYEQAKSLIPRELLARSTQEAGKALVAGTFTQTGLTYRALITGAP